MKKQSTLTADEAIAICRTPRPTPGPMKKVLAWAQSEKDPSHVLDLLLLQTGNYATRKDLGRDFHSALIACAAGDVSPLWKTVRGDWEIYRVWHALQALVALLDREGVQALVDLGREPLNPIHWKLIADAAGAAELSIPEEIERFQAECATTHSHIEHFEKRKESWAHEQEAPTPRTKSRAPKPAQQSVPLLAAAPHDPAFVKRFRDSLAKRFKPTRMEELFQALELGWYLTALDRTDEALKVAEYVTSQVSFSGDYNVWTPTGGLWVLIARLARIRNDKARSSKALELLREKPYEVYDRSVEAQRQRLSKLRGEFEEAQAEKSRKWACHTVARIVLPGAALFRETAVEGFSHREACPVDEFEDLIARAQAFLGKRLR